MTDEGRKRKSPRAESKEPAKKSSVRREKTNRQDGKDPHSLSSSALLSIFDGIDEVVYISDPCSYEILYANQALRAVRGDVIGEKCYRAFQGLDSPCPFCTNQYIFGENEGRSHVWEFRNSVNHRWYRCIDKAIPWPDGRMVRYEMAIDITEKKLADEALRESEAKFRTLADQSPNMIFINCAGRIVYVNNKCEEVMGYTKGEFCSPDFNFMDLVSPEYQDIVKSNFRRHARGEDVPEHEYVLITKSGRGIDTIIATKLIPYDGKLAILGIVTDISHYKRIESDIRKSEEKYRDLYDHAPDMYHTLDRSGIIIDCNETEARMLGYTKEEIIGRHLTDFFTGASKKLFEKDFPLLNYEKTQLNLEREFVRKDGSTFPASLNVFTEMDEEGRLLRTKTIARDVTEIKKMEAELLKGQKLESIGILAGGIAHDFNNILTAIMGNISMAAMYAKPGGELFQRLQEAEKASIRARDLTQQLLAFSRGWAPIKKTVATADLIRDAVGFSLMGSNVRCEFILPADIWPMEADEGQITQVLNNLVLNAVHAMPEGGIIAIGASNISHPELEGIPLPKGKYIKISVKDFGVGIPGEIQQKVFEPYFTTKKKGHGLGLASAYSIILKHGGHISLESAPGKGTTFFIYLPACADLMPETRQIPAQPVSGRGKVLIMDDEIAVAGTAAKMLGSLGYETAIAGEGGKAIELYLRAMESGQPYSAVIMDLTIPGGMGGRETIRRLREIAPDIRAIVSSGYPNDPVMLDYRKYGFCDLIAKPYKIADLSRAVHRVIQGGENQQGPELPVS